MTKYIILTIAFLTLIWGLEAAADVMGFSAPLTDEKAIYQEHYFPSNPTDFLQQWTAIAAPVNTPDRLAHATVYDPVGDKIYMIGGTPNGQLGSNVSLCQMYDPVTNTWTDKASMPTARSWIYGSYVRGKIYIIGGYSNTGAPLSVNEEYNIATNTWTTKASSPRLRMAALEAVWRDSLIYVMGGYSYEGGLRNVEIYNPFTNTWAIGTLLPEAADMGSAAIIGDTIYIAQAYNRPDNTNWPRLYKGAINPANPTQINWIAGPWLNMTISNGGTAAIGNCVYWLGGFPDISSGLGATRNCWKYDRTTDEITSVVPYPFSIARCNFMVARPANFELYVIAGDSGGDWSTSNKNYYKISYVPLYNNDVDVTILSPGSYQQPNIPMTLSGRVKNYGSSAQSNFQVVCSIFGTVSGLLYTNTQTVTSLAADDATIVNFTQWLPNVTDVVTVIMRTILTNDQNPANNRKTRTTHIVNNITQTEIGTSTTNSIFGPIRRTSYYSGHEAIYTASEINYSGNITNLAYYKHSGSNVNPILDVTIYMKHTSDTSFIGGASITTTGYTQVYQGAFTNDATEGWMEVELTTPFNYNGADNLQILIVKGYQASISSSLAPSYRYTTTTPIYRTRQGEGWGNIYLELTYNRPNIRFKFPALPNDVGVRSIIALTAYATRTPSVTPRVLIRNYGTSPQTNFGVYCSIFGTGRTLRHSAVSNVPLLNAGDTVTVSFANWNITTVEICTMRIRTALVGDINPNNNVRVHRTQVVRSFFTGGPDGKNMRWIDSDTIDGPIYNWIDISSYGDTCRTGEGFRGPLPLGFTFNFYDKPRTNFWFSSKGFISLDAITSAHLNNAGIPSTAAPNNIICPFWDDLITLGSWHHTFGDTMKIIQWRSRTISPSDTIIFQLILKNTGDIIFQYNRCDESLGRGRSATVGIEDSIGSIGLQYLFNGSPTGNLLSAGRAIKFYRLSNDVGVDAILSPGSTHTQNVSMTPKVKVKNYGILAQTFPVICSIVGSGGVLRYFNSQAIPFLASGRDTVINFETWRPTLPETVTVIMRTNLGNDQRPSNDRRTQTTRVISSVTMITPNGGECWAGGTYRWIKWRSTEAVFTRYVLLFSENSGATYTDTIANNIAPTETTYNWFVPMLDLTTCRVKVEIFDSGETSIAQDESDSDFTIYVNYPPVALDDNYNSDEDTPLNVSAPGVLENDTDPNSDPLTAVLVSSPYHASSFNLNSNGSFSYIPYSNFNGTDSFKYKAHDGTKYSNIAKVTITVQEVNDLPVATDDNYETNENTPLNVSAPGVLTNDIDVDGDPLTAVLELGPVNASSFNLNSNGSFNYTPNSNFNGIDSFKYKAYDGTEHSNNAKVTITVNIPGWAQKLSVPTNVLAKYVKDGGALVAAGSNLYALRGQKSNEFYKYIPEVDTWTLPFALDTIPTQCPKPNNPDQFNKKTPGKGAALCYDGNNTIYATKGNGTSEFYAYNITGNAWSRKAFIPALKGVKGGTSMVFKDGKVYLLAGSRPKPDSNNFFAYDSTTNTWEILTKAPTDPYNKVWKDGSCLTLFDNTIYALKGGDKQSYFYRYDVPDWTFIDSIPKLEVIGMKPTTPPKEITKSTTVKDGAGMASSGNAIYVVKGGGSLALWKRTATGWSQNISDTIPRLNGNNKSVVKTGAGLAYMNNALWLMKGNDRAEFWKYTPAKEMLDVPTPMAKTDISTQEAQTLKQVDSRLASHQGDKLLDITPNPFTKLATIRYTVPVSGKVSIKLYNASGRLIATLVNEYQNAGSHSLEIGNWKLEIPRGVYFMRYEADNNKSEVKLLIQ